MKTKPFRTAPAVEETYMKAVTIAAPHTIRLNPVRVPVPQGHEVRIRMEGCGLCASSLPLWEGRPWFDYPSEAGSPGHEGWGVVDAVGPNVASVRPGDRVTMLSHNAFAEYDLAHEACVAKLPDSLAGKPFPGEPLGCAMNIFRRSRIESGMDVAIIGAGFLGCLLARLARQAGARVIALSRRPSSLEAAMAFGAEEAWPVDNGMDVEQMAREFTSGALFHRVIEATGEQEPLTLAGKLAAIRGRLIIAGYHQDGHRAVDMQLWNWRGLDVINAHEREPERYMEGIREAIHAVEEGRLDPFPLFTHIIPKEEAGKAFELQQKKPSGFIKALVDFT